MVTRLDVHHKLNADDLFTPYLDLVNGRNKFPHILDGEKNYVTNRDIQRNDLIWKDNKCVIPMSLLTLFFSINREPSMDFIIRFKIEQDTWYLVVY